MDFQPLVASQAAGSNQMEEMPLCRRSTQETSRILEATASLFHLAIPEIGKTRMATTHPSLLLVPTIGQMVMVFLQLQAQTAIRRVAMGLRGRQEVLETGKTLAVPMALLPPQPPEVGHPALPVLCKILPQSL